MLLLPLVLLALVIRTFLYEPFNLPSGSMIPTLAVGDVFIVSKFAYGYTRHSFLFSIGPFSGRIFAAVPRRGDLVIFKYPRDNRTDYIKRLVGLPGDTVQMRDGRLFINGVLVERERLGDFEYKDSKKSDARVVHAIAYKEMLPDGAEHLILEEGDDRRFDNTPEFHVPEGYYFMLGDNRDHSADSRADVGFVPDENLVGKYVLTLWNDNEGRYKFTRAP